VSDSTSADFFEQMYRANPDPWNFAGDAYECSRYEATIASLGATRYGRAFEPGCSVGALTWRLAQCCDHVDAMDISATAIVQAKRRCSDLANVELTVGSLPHHIPGGEFDLIVFSEIGYYFDEETLRALATTLVSQIRASGTLLAVHWLGTSKDHVLSGDCVHEVLGRLSGLRLEQSERHEKFRLDRWVRV
jgi:cyclopropane fatty-acyl-phospholipid synthase-like methyltransferase